MTGIVVGDLYPLAPGTIAQAEALIDEHYEMTRGTCWCGRVYNGSFATHLVQVLASAGLLASLAHLDEPRPVDAPAPRPARRTTPFAASGGPRVFSDGGC